MAKHRADVPFRDRVQDKYRNRPSDYARAKHRAYGPPQKPTLHDMTPDEFTAIKGAGPRY